MNGQCQMFVSNFHVLDLFETHELLDTLVLLK